MINIETNNDILKALDKMATNVVRHNNFEEMYKDIEWTILSKRNKETVKQAINQIYDDNRIENLDYDAKLVTENPYNKNIKLDNIKDGHIKVDNKVLPKNTLHSIGFIEVQDRYLNTKRNIGCNNSNISIPILIEDKEVWMSPTLSEINTIQPAVDKARGKVLTFGLGLGYYVYMALLKPEVESITVVEYNPKVIKIFKDYILPQFKIDKPIEIIEGDLFDYYNMEFLNKFDYVFIDTWKGNEDGLDDYYIPMMEKMLPPAHVDFWIEESILYPVRLLVMSYLSRLAHGLSITEFIGQITDSSNRNILIKINRYFKKSNKVIDDFMEIVDIINDKELMREIIAYKR